MSSPGCAAASPASCSPARLSGAGPGTGAGLEILALTAAVVGGNSLGGGRGSIVKGAMGAIIVLVMTNGLIRLGFGTGFNQMVLGLLLAVAVVLDIRWLKNRDKVLNELYVAPIHHRMGETQSALPASGTPYALNDRLAKTEYIGLGEIEGPEDVILDRDDHLYCGTRHGEIVRFFAPDYKRSEVFAHTGGFPLGLAFDQDGNLLSCVGAMGLYSISKAGEVTKLSRRDAPHLDLDRRRCAAARSQRLRRRAGRPHLLHRFHHPLRRARMGGGFDREPADRPPAVLRPERPARPPPSSTATATPTACASPMTASRCSWRRSWACRVYRYWFDGPKKGQVECVIKDMPGYPDNINRASDGTYWMAWLGMRTPSFDLALRSPGMRKRMTRRLPQDEWLFPNINTGGVVKFDEAGRIVETLGDLSGESHPMVTSMREHKGWLYVGGILNNRIGRYRIPGADPSWTGPDSYWGKR